MDEEENNEEEKRDPRGLGQAGEEGKGDYFLLK